MNALLIYVVKVAVYITAFYLVYATLLSRDTSYGRNRAFILFSLFTSLFLPLLTLHTLRPHGIQFFGKFLSEVFVRPASGRTDSINQIFSLSDPLLFIYTVYLLGVIVFTLKLLADILNLLFLIARQKIKGSRIIRFNGFNTSGFSAMGYIFLNNNLSHEEACEIIRHEKNHLKQAHFIDIMFIELLKAFQWFNPVIHLFNRSLRAIHEYQADYDCLRAGIPVFNYQSLLLSQVFKTRSFNLTNSFSNPSLIKKRMVMMTKKPTSAIASFKLLLVIPVTAVIFMAISAYKEIPEQSEKKIIADADPQLSTQTKIIDSQSITSDQQTESDNTVSPPPPPPPPQQSKAVGDEPDPYIVVEEMPQFPGGDPGLLKFIGENTIYPESAKEQNIQGRVIIRFCVTAKGGINQVSVLKGVSPELDMEAIRVVKTIPAFAPGRQGGNPVPVWYMVPITFTLHI